jgi:hypothetical protein
MQLEKNLAKGCIDIRSKRPRVERLRPKSLGAIRSVSVCHECHYTQTHTPGSRLHVGVTSRYRALGSDDALNSRTDIRAPHPISPSTTVAGCALKERKRTGPSHSTGQSFAHHLSRKRLIYKPFLQMQETLGLQTCVLTLFPLRLSRRHALHGA